MKHGIIAGSAVLPIGTYVQPEEDLIIRCVVEAAKDAGIERFVYTSTVGCIGIPKDGIGNETTPVGLGEGGFLMLFSRFVCNFTYVARRFCSTARDAAISSASATSSPRPRTPASSTCTTRRSCVSRRRSILPYTCRASACRATPGPCRCPASDAPD